jgi:hypothetical protein
MIKEALKEFRELLRVYMKEQRKMRFSYLPIPDETFYQVATSKGYETFTRSQWEHHKYYNIDKLIAD